MIFLKKDLQFQGGYGIIQKLYLFYLPVAQLDSASDSDSEGQRFESARVGQKNNEAIASLFFIQAAGLVWNLALACMALPKA